MKHIYIFIIIIIIINTNTNMYIHTYIHIHTHTHNWPYAVFCQLAVLKRSCESCVANLAETVTVRHMLSQTAHAISTVGINMPLWCLEALLPLRCKTHPFLWQCNLRRQTANSKFFYRPLSCSVERRESCVPSPWPTSLPDIVQPLNMPVGADAEIPLPTLKDNAMRNAGSRESGPVPHRTSLGHGAFVSHLALAAVFLTCHFANCSNQGPCRAAVPRPR